MKLKSLLGLGVSAAMLTSAMAGLGTASAADTCVKIVATYEESGALSAVEIEPVSRTEAVAQAVRDGNTTTMYWDSFEHMAPAEPLELVEPATIVTVGDGVQISADDLDAKEYTETVVLNDVYIGAGDAADDTGKHTESVTVDANDKNFNGTQYTQRIKTGGAGNLYTGIRTVYFKVDSDCTLVLDATASSTGEIRDVVVLHGATEEHLSIGSDPVSQIVTGIKAGETVYIYSTSGGLNISGLALTLPAEEKPTNPPQEEVLVHVGAGIAFSADSLEAAADATTSVIEKDGFYIGTGVTIDSNTATINGINYTQRIKTGGKSTVASLSKVFYFTPDADCAMELHATTSSTSTGSVRDVTVSHGGTEEHLSVSDKDAYKIENLKAGETVMISTDGGLNVYGIVLIRSGLTSWEASESDIGKTAGAELMLGLTLVSDNSSTSSKYVTAASDPSWEEDVLSGAALKYEASAAGTLSVSFSDLGDVDRIKTAVITDAAGEVLTSYTTAGEAKESFALTYEVAAGDTYYIYGQGTKARFAAASFTPAE